MPKRCRSKEASQQIMRLACRTKVKKLKKYEQDFIALKGWCEEFYSLVIILCFICQQD